MKKMFCGLQQDNRTDYLFIPCSKCMMNVYNDEEKCHYYFPSVEAFVSHKLVWGKDYDEEKLAKQLEKDD